MPMTILLIFLLKVITVVCVTKIAGRTGNDGMKNVNIMVPLKYLSTFWRALEISLFVKLIFF